MDREWYIEEYWNKERSLKDIGKELGVHPQTVLNRMKKFNIPRRSSATHTETTKQKLSELRSGNGNPWFGKKRPKHSRIMKEKMKGRVHSEETRQKMSDAKKGICGPEHNKWIHPDKRKGALNKNIRRLKKMKEWREAVFKRDDYTCQKCSSRGTYLHADHIKPLHFLIKECKITKPSEAIAEPKIWEIANGKTLCVDCHKATKTFGAKIRKIDGFK